MCARHHSVTCRLRYGGNFVKADGDLQVLILLFAGGTDIPPTKGTRKWPTAVRPRPLGIRRRSVLFGAAAGAGALALGAGPLTIPAQAATFVKGAGADISWLPQREQVLKTVG